MKLSTDLFKGDAVKTHKVLMKKLNKDGFFKEIQSKRFHVSKGEKRRQREKLAVARERSRRIKVEKKLDAIDASYYKKPSNRVKNVRTNTKK